MSKQGSGSKSKTASGKDKQPTASSGGKKVPAAVKAGSSGGTDAKGKKGKKEGAVKVVSKKEKRAQKHREDDDGGDLEVDPSTAEKNTLKAMFQKNHGWPDYVWLKGTAYDSNLGPKKKRNMNMNIQVPNFDLHIGKGQRLLESAELSIQYGTRYGIIGRNGIGKSVLLRAISSREGPFSCIPSWYSILHVEQEIVGDERPPLEIVLASDRERLWLLSEVARLEAVEEEKSKRDDARAEKAAAKEKEEEEKKKKAAEDEQGKGGDGGGGGGDDDEDDDDDDDDDFEEEDFQHYTLQDVYERLREIEAHKAEARAASILAGLQFDDQEMKTKPSREYSGGWRMRISLARALFMVPELLILDEPTNHLDLHASIWLEHYLSKYKKTLLLVSHDESILNDCVDSIIHFFDHKLHRYRGNYATFLTVREQNEAAAQKKLRSQNAKVEHDRKAAEKNAGGKLGARKKKEVEKTLAEKVEIVRDEKAPHFKFPKVGTKQETAVLKFDNVSYGYNEHQVVIKDLSFGVYMDSRIALVGANGTGKSTIMKLMSGEIKPDSGSVVGSNHLRVVKYDQHAEEGLDLSATCVEWLQRHAGELGEPEARKLLGKFGLTGKLALQTIGTLSGGQKARLVFATLAQSGPHLMLLDEPTNHLDLFAIRALAEGLEAYEGGLVIISHNQKILAECCNQTWVVHDQTVTKYEGSFLEYKDQIVQHLMAADDSDDEDVGTIKK